MTTNELFARINSLNRKNACLVLSHVYGRMQDHMKESDLKSILICLEHYEAQEIKELDKSLTVNGVLEKGGM